MGNRALKVAMAIQDLTGLELARRVGCSNITISKIMHGHHKPKAETAAAIAEALHTTPEALGLEIYKSHGRRKAVSK